MCKNFRENKIKLVLDPVTVPLVTAPAATAPPVAAPPAITPPVTAPQVKRAVYCQHKTLNNYKYNYTFFIICKILLFSDSNKGRAVGVGLNAKMAGMTKDFLRNVELDLLSYGRF